MRGEDQTSDLLFSYVDLESRMPKLIGASP
jgi:hypothetical protein